MKGSDFIWFQVTDIFNMKKCIDSRQKDGIDLYFDIYELFDEQSATTFFAMKFCSAPMLERFQIHRLISQSSVTGILTLSETEMILSSY